MAWIKRNLFFVIGGGVAVALMGLAGWYLWSQYEANNQVVEKLNADYAELDQLNQQKPHPGVGKVNNIEKAKEQQKELLDLLQKQRACFQRVAPIPDMPKVTERDFSAALSRVIAQLQRDATNASITLPPNYAFSFEAQKRRVEFSPNSLGPLAVQLGEVKAICDVLYAAKINSLDNLRRESVSTDDQQTGSQTDYLSQRTVTNELAVMTPYEVTVHTLSSELASVLAGFANSPYGIIVKSINVEVASPGAVDQTPDAPVAALPVMVSPAEPRPNPGMSDAFRRRYGLGRGMEGPGGRYGPRPPTPQPAPQPMAVVQGAPVKVGPVTVLDERQLKVTLTLCVVKLLPPK